jgi:hypothetical protein
VRQAIPCKADISVRIEELHGAAVSYRRSCSFKDVVQKKLRPAVVPAVRTLVVKAPVVRKVFNVVLSACSKLTGLILVRSVREFWECRPLSRNPA